MSCDCDNRPGGRLHMSCDHGVRPSWQKGYASPCHVILASVLTKGLLMSCDRDIRPGGRANDRPVQLPQV